MTAPLRHLDTALGIGRRLRDCDDGEVLTIVGTHVAADGLYYAAVDERGKGWLLFARHSHDAGEPHLPQEMFRDGPELVCYEWVPSV